jgi:hypothetical protein
MQYPKMVPLKLSLTYDPPQIGLFYRRHESDDKKQVYIIQLHGLIYLGDSRKITNILFEQHSDYLSPSIISKQQVQRFVDKLLNYLKSQLLEYEEEQEVSARVAEPRVTIHLTTETRREQQ